METCTAGWRGERPGETDQQQCRHRAPGRLIPVDAPAPSGWLASRVSGCLAVWAGGGRPVEGGQAFRCPCRRLGMMLHGVGEIDSVSRGPEVSVRRVLAAVALVVLVVCEGGALWWQSQQVPVREYRDVQVMAEMIGCQDSFVTEVSPAATSAGRCLVNGSPVQLRTFVDQGAGGGVAGRGGVGLGGALVRRDRARLRGVDPGCDRVGLGQRGVGLSRRTGPQVQP